MNGKCYLGIFEDLMKLIIGSMLLPVFPFLSNQNGEMKEFKTYCVSYMICKKYGLETSQFDFTNLPKELAYKEKGKGIRIELEDIRTNFTTVNSKIMSYFEQEEKTKKNKEKER